MTRTFGASEVADPSPLIESARIPGTRPLPDSSMADTTAHVAENPLSALLAAKESSAKCFGTRGGSVQARLDWFRSPVGRRLFSIGLKSTFTSANGFSASLMISVRESPLILQSDVLFVDTLTLPEDYLEDNN